MTLGPPRDPAPPESPPPAAPSAPAVTGDALALPAAEADSALRSPHRAPDAGEDPRVTGEMPFLEHLDELRGVLTRIVAAAVIGAIGGWWLSPQVLEDVIRRTVGRAIVL